MQKSTHMQLRNQDSVRYFNSLLQCLFFTLEFREAILSCNNVGDSHIMYHLQRLCLMTDNSSPNTEEIIQYLMMNNVCQLEVVKCFQLLMNKIIEDKEEIQEPYQVKIVQSTTCHGGHYLMRLEKPVLNLTFSFHKCAPPPTVYSVRFCFETLPQILVIHLKRDPADINAGVSGLPSLKLETEKQLDTDYELFVVCHHFRGIRSDQYMVEIKSVKNDCWHRFTDTYIQKNPEGQICVDEQQSATSSLLLYHRVYSDARPSKPAGPSAESMGNFDTGDTSSQGASPACENEMSWEMENAAMQEGGSPASSRSASPVQLPSDPREGTYVGLRNQGSTCYLNSLLQCLFFTRELREAILSCNNCDSGIVCQLKKLFQKLLKHDKSAPSTKRITKCLGVRNVHQQQDVAEYFRILMNKIVEEKEEIQTLYQVKMVHSIICQGCGQETRIQQNPVLSLALSLDKYTSNCEVYSVHNALDAVQKVNEFTDDKVYCETCRSKQEATSGCHFETLPQILVLNLKRYQFDGNQFKKLRYEVSVPFSLTVNSEEQPNTQYELFAICHHSGGIYSGHYVAEIKSFENDCWYSFNDTTVNKVQEEWNTTGAKNSSTAYLLMYRKAACDAKPKMKCLEAADKRLEAEAKHWEVEAQERREAGHLEAEERKEEKRLAQVYTREGDQSKLSNFSSVNNIAEVDVLRPTHRSVFTMVSRQLLLLYRLCLLLLRWWSSKVNGRALGDRSLPADPAGSVDIPLEMEMELKRLELEKAKLDQLRGLNGPPPDTTPRSKKFPTYKVGDDTEALENSERACLGYNIPTDQYMVKLRPQLSGPLAKVAAEMPKEHTNKYKVFEHKAKIRMTLTPELAQWQFRALKWKPDIAFSQHAYHIVNNWEAWISAANVKSLEDLSLLIQMEQFLQGVPDEIKRYILDRKPKTVIEAGKIGAKWVEKKKASSSWCEYQKGQLEQTPHHRGQPKVPPHKEEPSTQPGRPQMPSHPITLLSNHSPRPTPHSAGRCFKCNVLGHVKTNCPKSTSQLQLISPGSHQEPSGPDASQIPPEQRETVSVGGRKITAWRDTGVQVSAIHQSLVDSKFINPEAQEMVQPFKANSFNLPTAKLPVQDKGWSGMRTFSVLDDYPIPMLLGENLAKMEGMVTRSQAKQASTPNSIPELPTGTQPEVVKPDPRPESMTVVADPVSGTQPEPAQGSELVEQSAPEPVLATPSELGEPEPKGATEPAPAAAAKLEQEGQLEPSAPVDSGLQSTETHTPQPPPPASLPGGPSPNPQPQQELMSPASREQFQAEQETDDCLKRDWTVAQSGRPTASQLFQ